MDFTKYFCIALITTLLLSIYTLTMVSNAKDSWYCRDGWFIDIAFIVSVHGHDKAYFDVPINYSDSTYNQSIYIVRTGGTAYITTNNSGTYVALNLSNMSIAYFIAQFKVCGLRDVIKAPSLNTNISWNFPGEVLKYVKNPHPIISNVRKDFEDWLYNKMNVSIETLNPLKLSYYASIFIYYSDYITYKASPYPRDLEEIIDTRIGDCDDMSRVLINLLWSYGVPAKIEDAYVWIDWTDFNLTMEIEESVIVFEKTGPHAYVLAYIPTYGWAALDLLGQYAFNPFAGSRHLIPVLILGHDENASVSKEVIEEFKQFHREVIYIELIGIYSDQEIENEIGERDLNKFVEFKLNEIKELARTYLNISDLNKTTTPTMPTIMTTLTTPTTPITSTIITSTSKTSTVTITEEIITTNTITTSFTTVPHIMDITTLLIVMLVVICIGIVVILLRK